MITDYRETKLRFFDHYLKDLDTWDEPRVRYFRMGTGDGSNRDGKLFHGGEWTRADDWPLPGTRFTKYYARDDGTLAPEKPDARDSSTTYQFDPDDPVPTLGGNCSSYYTFEPREEMPLTDRPTISITGRSGWDQRIREDTFGADPPYRPLEERDDVIVFRKPLLPDPVEIAGPIKVCVYGSTDAPDTDFTAKLIDEYPPSRDYPSGFALNLADSICRARYRGYRCEADFVELGEIFEFYMEPYPTANRFGERHRIRLDISSSNYPRYDVNPNTGRLLYGDRESRIATNTIYHELDHPTHVELPVQTP